MNEQNRIISPEGVSQLMKEIWMCHQAGQQTQGSNIFFVDLPQPTEKDLEQMRRTRATKSNPINQTDLTQAIAKLGGW